MLLMLVGLTVSLSGSILLDRSTNAGGGVVVDSYTVRGDTVLVRLYNGGPTTTASAGVTVNLGSQTQAGISSATTITAGKHATVLISFQGPVVGITEGPDPIPM